MNNQLKFFVVGEKGGVGKTWFAFILIEFLRHVFNRLPTIVDMDTSTPNIAKTYLKEISAHWSNASLTKTSTSGIFESEAEIPESESKDISRIEQLLQDQISLTNDREGLMGDKLMEILAISNETVVAMPSQSQRGLCEWLDRSPIEHDDKDDALSVFWWVSDGSFESLQLFDRFVCQYPPSELIQYCLVINKGSRDIDWARYKLVSIYPDIYQLITTGEIKAIEIEKIGFEPSVLRQLQEQGLSFADVLNGEPKTNKFFMNRFNGWLELCYDRIRATGYIPVSAATISGSNSKGKVSGKGQVAAAKEVADNHAAVA
jgi:hypothetical protein